MKIQNFTKLAAVAVLSMGLASCFTIIDVKEEVSVALAKWQGKKIGDFFFRFGKGEFQAKNSQGTKAYSWQSKLRVVEIVGQTYVVQVPHTYLPGQFVNKVITEASKFYNYQCILRIETTSANVMKTLEVISGVNECNRYFSLSDAEREALSDAKA
ncbi:MAG: hypothetical protein HRU29_06020 [Rhizobiales bacterium]|nr:hypothetical protein [Hyphomicrobiales bacterium]NRB13942.1 hypothetical protein [Hyphomicrobiales bacterium]